MPPLTNTHAAAVERLAAALAAALLSAWLKRGQSPPTRPR
jgi:hypothetical protein